MSPVARTPYRGRSRGTANTVHTVIWGVLTPLLMLAGIGASAAAFGRKFRVYAILTLAALMALSVLAGIEAARITTGAPGHWFGATERALIGVWLQWVVVMAMTLLRARPGVALRRPGEPAGRPALTPQGAPW